MLRKLRARLTFANVASSIALLLSLSGGVAYATHLQVFSGDIVDGEVRTVDVAASAVNSAKVADNSLKGTDISEATLVGVDAAKLQGHTADSLIRVGSKSRRAAVDIPDCDPGLDYLVYTISAPRAGFALVNATFTVQANFDGGWAFAARIEHAPSLLVGDFVEASTGKANSRYSVPVTGVFPVSAGSNTFVLKVCDSFDPVGSAMAGIAAQMTILFSPFQL